MKRTPKTFPALAWRIVSLTLALWLCCMGILTCCVASDMRMQVEEKLRMYVDYSGSRQNHEDTALPGTVEHNMIDDLGRAYIWINIDKLLPFVTDQHFSGHISDDDWMWGKWDLYYGYEPAVIYYDENREELIRTGDYLSFDYTTDINWAQQNLYVIGKGYVVLDDIPGGSERFEHVLSNHAIGDIGMGMLFPVLRLTGWFEGNQFHPTLIENGDYLDYHGREMDIERLAQLDARGKVEWDTMLTGDAPEGQELITIYAWEPGGYNCTQKPVAVNGKSYDSLADLLHAALSSDNLFAFEKRSLLESVLIYSRGHSDVYGDYILSAAVRCKPLQYAVMRLVLVYFGSFAVVAVILWRILRKLHSEVATPLRNMILAARDGYNITPVSDWAEPAALEEYFVQTHQTLAENKSELTQLRTALEYAHDAEEKRKTLISNITHELKTPLAIIHSYTECLSEDVATEKREQYLTTILEETEKMDGMVLQMLELSRLEAGRVRLASEYFSLLDLTKAIAHKMAPLLKERELKLHYDFVQDFPITADEGRIGQVISNLLSNAQKYTTEGGDIRIKTFLTRGTACFRITNTVPHLSDETLEKVWDSFYRADDSRNTPGTGLGLTLVKTIIALHGGSCTVQNTIMEDGSEGVEFGFEIPVK